jgi:hypothetical protein
MKTAEGAGDAGKYLILANIGSSNVPLCVLCGFHLRSGKVDP